MIRGERPLTGLLGSGSVFAGVPSAVVEDPLAAAGGEHELTLGQLRFLAMIASPADWTLG